MNRVLVVLLVVVATAGVSGAATAQETPEACAGNVTNDTIRSLCDRVEALEQRNSNLKSNVSSLQEQKIKLEHELETTESYNVTQELEAMGAMHPDREGLGLLVFRIQDPTADNATAKYGLFQYVGPENGEVSLGGYDAYTRIELEKTNEENKLSPLTIQLVYTPEGIAANHTFGVSDAETQLRLLEGRFNREASFFAWTRWNNNERQSAEQTESRAVYLYGAGTLLVGILGVFAESRLKIVTKRRQKKEQRAAAAHLDGRRYRIRDRIRGFFDRFRRD